jgi:hypothetical protein
LTFHVAIRTDPTVPAALPPAGHAYKVVEAAVRGRARGP